MNTIKHMPPQCTSFSQKYYSYANLAQVFQLHTSILPLGIQYFLVQFPRLSLMGRQPLIDHPGLNICTSFTMKMKQNPVAHVTTISTKVYPTNKCQSNSNVFANPVHIQQFVCQVQCLHMIFLMSNRHKKLNF